jgi:hypothetical protein
MTSSENVQPDLAMEPATPDNFIDDLSVITETPLAEVPNIKEALALEPSITAAQTLNSPPAEHDPFIDDIPAKSVETTGASPAAVPHLDDWKDKANEKELKSKSEICLENGDALYKKGDITGARRSYMDGIWNFINDVDSQDLRLMLSARIFECQKALGEQPLIDSQADLLERIVGEQDRTIDGKNRVIVAASFAHLGDYEAATEELDTVKPDTSFDDDTRKYLRSEIETLKSAGVQVEARLGKIGLVGANETPTPIAA